MLFRRNKINKGINDAASSSASTTSDFTSLNEVKIKRKQNRLVQKLFINQYHYAVENFNQKKNSIKNYLKLNWFFLIKIFLCLLLLVSFILGCVISFEPFFVGSPTDTSFWTPVNNFYLAKPSGSGYTFSLTNKAIAFIVIFGLSFLLTIFYFVYSAKKNTLIYKKSKVTKIISISCYVLLILSFLLLFISLIIPPSFNSQLINGQQVANLKNLIENSTGSEQESYIRQLYELFNLSVPNSDLLANYKTDYINGVFSIPTTEVENYFFSHNVYLYRPSNLNAVGITFVCLISIFAFVACILLPIILFALTIKIDIKLNAGIKDDWNAARKWIFLKASTMKLSFFKKVKEINDKPSFRKYKKQLREEGAAQSDREQLFGSEKIDNSRTNIITKQEIESHEPNKAFLNNQGQWMYHDGNHNYFIVKNDEWVSYDINSEIHEAHVNINFDKKQQTSKNVKERKLFKNSKFLNKIDEKKKSNNNNVSVDLPDEELDKIIGELDI